MIGGWVRDWFCLCPRPSGIIDVFDGLDNRGAKD